MKTNNTKRWSIGCKIVQWRINTQHHRTINDTPNHLVYGQHPCIGISNLPISEEVLTKLVTEAELNQVYSEFAGEPTDDVPQLPVPESYLKHFRTKLTLLLVADVANAGALVSLSPALTKRKKRAAQADSTLDTRCAIRARRDALMEAVLPSTTANRR
jgi:hypothetical protein